MTDSVINLIEYETENGRRPFREWLSVLHDRIGANQVRVRLARMRLGNLGDVRSVGRGVHEARVASGPGYRIYFGRRGDWLVVLLCGGDKGSQARDIERAQMYWADFLRRLE